MELHRGPGSDYDQKAMVISLERTKCIDKLKNP